jgi:uncharacterized protein YbaA (DUF1428 family)
MTYVDGFVIPVKKSEIGQYRKMARLGAKVWMEHGALDYKECVADDLSALQPDGSRAPSLFPDLVRAKRGETVVFSYIVYRSKAHRDAVNKRVFSDPRITGLDPADMPVDMGRMATAGFKTLVEASAGKRGKGDRKTRLRKTSSAERRMERLPLSGRPF